MIKKGYQKHQIIYIVNLFRTTRVSDQRTQIQVKYTAIVQAITNDQAESQRNLKLALLKINKI